MINLTSFILTHTTPGEITITQLLDFLENAPNLQKVDLYSATPTSSPQNGRLVSLTRLKWMYTIGGGPSSLLLDHLLIPVGAQLTTEVELPSPQVVDPPPRFLDNLRNLHNFTAIRLYGYEAYPHMRFSGPNGEVRMTLINPRVNVTSLVLGSLSRFDTTKTEQLDIINGDPLSSNPLYYALLPMKDLRTLTLCHCRSPHIFIRTLNPSMRPSGTMVSPKLEELVLELDLDREEFDIRSVIEMARSRALGGAKLRVVKIVDRNADPKVDSADVLELRKHVRDVVDYQYLVDEEGQDVVSAASSW